MLKRLWIVLSIGWAAVILACGFSEPSMFGPCAAIALAPFAMIPIAGWVWTGRWCRRASEPPPLPWAVRAAARVEEFGSRIGPRGPTAR